MLRCYSVFRLVRTNSGSIQKNPIYIRKYGGNGTPIKRATMSELPVPSGSWAANYAKRNVQNNTLLIIGAGVFGVSLTVAIKSDIINWSRGPGFPELEPREPFIQNTSGTQEIQSSGADTQETKSSDSTSSPVKESSEPKSEEVLHTVEVLDPIASKENIVENKEMEETESLIETEDSTGKDVVIITDDSSLDTSSSSSSINEETGSISSPNA